MTLDSSVSQSLSALASKIKGFVVGQIGSHNSSSTAHADIRNSIPTTTSQLTNNSGFLTSHQDISGKLNTADLVDELNNVVLDLIEEGE